MASASAASISASWSVRGCAWRRNSFSRAKKTLRWRCVALRRRRRGRCWRSTSLSDCLTAGTGGGVTSSARPRIFGPAPGAGSSWLTGVDVGCGGVARLVGGRRLGRLGRGCGVVARRVGCRRLGGSAAGGSATRRRAARSRAGQGWSPRRRTARRRSRACQSWGSRRGTPRCRPAGSPRRAAQPPAPPQEPPAPHHLRGRGRPVRSAPRSRAARRSGCRRSSGSRASGPTCSTSQSSRRPRPVPRARITLATHARGPHRRRRPARVRRPRLGRAQQPGVRGERRAPHRRLPPPRRAARLRET